MLVTMETCLRKAVRRLGRWGMDDRVRSGGLVLLYGSGGFVLSAAALRGAAQPLAMGLICAVTGWRALVMAAGAALGYRVFWGQAGLQGMVWSAVGCLLALVLGKRKWLEDMPLLMPALSGVAVAVTGLTFLFFRQGEGFPLFLLRIALAPAASWFFHRSLAHRESLTDWLWAGVGTLALARVAPVSWLSAGYAAAGILGVWASFPAAAMAGLGLDIANITMLPMGPVVCLAALTRQLPFSRRWMRGMLPSAAWLTLSLLGGIWDFRPLPGLLLGGMAGILLPPRHPPSRQAGQTGLLQVRLELTAGVFSQLQQMMLEIRDPPIDEEALLRRAMDRICRNCVSREHCQEQYRLSLAHLHDPMSFTCRRPADIHPELLCSRERLRSLKADRLRRQEYRVALMQQYRFLAVYLQNLSDRLPRRGERFRANYRLEVSARSRGKETATGDRCMAFPGTGVRYYILLCDGMGTGPGAAREGLETAQLLKKMLTAGFPPEHALRSLNSLLALGNRAGAVTLDLAEVKLDSGRVSVYKWGAAPSYLLRKSGTEKIGTATPPPGIRVTDIRETVVRLSLRRGEMLILLSDGVEAGECLRRGETVWGLGPGEVAQRILEECGEEEGDDATVAALRLMPRRTST